MLVKLILFVLLFLRLVSNATASDSHIMYSPWTPILLVKITNFVVVVRQECGMKQTRVVDIIPQP